MGYITLPELGRLLGVGLKQIRSAHEAGFLSEPPRVSGRRDYDLGEVVRVAEYFGVAEYFKIHGRWDRPGKESNQG